MSRRGRSRRKYGGCGNLEGTVNATIAKGWMNSTSALRLGGMQVVVSQHVPKLHVGTEIEPIYPNLFKRWYLRLLRRQIYPVRFRPCGRIEQEQVLSMNGKLIMSAAAWASMRDMAA